VHHAESGYVVVRHAGLHLISDVGRVGPDYQPGHAHADTFSFVLYDGATPIIVDPGISTYEIGSRRDWERSTSAHNTLTIDSRNSSDVWSGFRVGKRAKVAIETDAEELITASHNGYYPAIHKRTFQKSNKGFSILDEITGQSRSSEAQVRFYFHPNIVPINLGQGKFKLTDNLVLEIEGGTDETLQDYQFCEGYNSLKEAHFLSVTVLHDTLITTIISQA
jgi:uncharacterized heparinase superfamily protein